MNTENNKIIAEFMGWKVQENPTERFFGRYKSPIGTWYKEIDLSFHHDWNWLMEVVDKIESLEYLNKKSTCEGFDSFGIEINKNRCDITHYGDFTHHLLQGNGKTRIESTYNACVDFIKWYNEQNR